MISELPLSELGVLLETAHRKETEQEQAEIEKRLFPMWIVQTLGERLQGKQHISYTDFLKAVFDKEHKPSTIPHETRHEKTGEEILAEYMPIVEAERRANIG